MRSVVFGVVWTLIVPVIAVAQLSSQFVYQGLLKDGGLPVSGDYGMAFQVWDAAENGQAVTSTIDVQVSVTNGTFTVPLDFGPGPFETGADRWLEISVDGVLLQPRQALAPTPYAITAGGVVDNVVTTPKLADIAVTTAKLADDAVTTPKIADNAVTAVKSSTRTFAAIDPSGVTVLGESLQSVSVFGFQDVPAGDLLISVVVYGQRPAVNTFGKLRLVANGSEIAQYGSHCFNQFASPSIWGTLTMVETLPDFAGGSLSIELRWSGDRPESGVTFGFDNDARFARRCRVLAGM